MTPQTRRLARILSFGGLALSLLPALLVFHGTIAKETYYQLIAAGMLLWFSTAVLWIKPDHFDG